MKKIYGICFLLTFLSGSLFAQQLTWRNAGPDNTGSKTRAIIVDGNRIVAGSAGGGLWYSDDGGTAWKRMDSYANQKCNPVVTTMAKDKNSGTWYVGTGETALINGAKTDNSVYDFSNDSTGFFGFIGNPGAGVYVSTDGGANWSNANGTTSGTYGSGTSDNKGPFVAVNKVLVHSSGRVYIATRQGLFYSDDNLATVDIINAKLDTTVLMKTYKPGPAPQQPKWPQNFESSTIFDIEEGKNGAVYATAYALNSLDNTRISWYYRSTQNTNKNEGQPYFLAADSIKIGGVLTKIGKGGKRAELAVAPSDNSYLYIAGLSGGGELSGIWRSTDNAQSWEIAAPQGNPGFTPLALRDKNYHTFVLQVTPDNPRSLIVAGNAWYSYTDDRGWTQTAQSANPNSFSLNYVPTSVYCIGLDPNNAKTYYIGTDKQIIKYSTERDPRFNLDIPGFRQRSKGYEGALCVSVASMQVEQNDVTDPDNPIQTNLDAIMTGTSNNGILYNKFYTQDGYFAQQGFGRINANNWSNVEASSLYPGNLVVQRADQGLEISTNYGQSYSSFYGTFEKPNVFGLTKKDSLIDRDKPNPKAEDPKGSMRDRLAVNGYYVPNISQFVLDEYIPDSMLNKGKAALQSLNDRIFFCSYKYLWVVNYPYRDSVKWNRITNDLVTSGNAITAITVSGDDQHTVYVGTSTGDLYRVTRPDNLANYKVDVNVVKLNTTATGLQKGRWISSISVDPNDTKRVIVTYAAFGKFNTLDKSKLVCMTSDITAANPVFTGITPANMQGSPVFCSKIVKNPNNNGTSVLLVGTGSGLFSSTDWATFTPENEAEIGNVPVTDIYVRKYKATITDVVKKDFTLSKDNTIYVSTYGRGVFYTSDYKYPRTGGNEVEPAVITEESMKVYPNPATNLLHLDIELVENANVEVSLVGVDGKIITTLEPINLDNGKNTIDFNTQSLADGVYFLHVTTKSANNSTDKMLKFVVGK